MVVATKWTASLTMLAALALVEVSIQQLDRLEIDAFERLKSRFTPLDYPMLELKPTRGQSLRKTIVTPGIYCQFNRSS